MALDGSLRDASLRPRGFFRTRPLNQSQATELLPLFIYRLKQGVLSLTTRSCPDLPEVFHFSNPKRPEELWILLRVDLDSARSVASKVDIGLFPTEPVGSVLARIRARVAVEYAGR